MYLVDFICCSFISQSDYRFFPTVLKASRCDVIQCCLLEFPCRQHHFLVNKQNRSIVMFTDTVGFPVDNKRTVHSML